MTIPKRTSELLEEQWLDVKEASWKDWVLPAIATGVTTLGILGTGFTGGASDAAAAGIDGALLGTDAAATATGAATATDAAATDAAATATDAAAKTTTYGNGSNYVMNSNGLYGPAGAADAGAASADGATSGGIKGLAQKFYNKYKKPAAIGYASNKATGLIGGGGGITPNVGPYGGGTGGGGPIQIGRMLSSKQAASTMEMEILEKVKDIPRLLEMILETICGCGQPTSGKFNGMPHCLPGSGCSESVAFSPSNPTGDACCSCGNPNCSGSFHGQPVCAPGQGCNDHWDAEKGARKWNPAMETPSEKIKDHDDWASSTNHGEFEMPDGDGDADDRPQTTWE